MIASCRILGNAVRRSALETQAPRRWTWGWWAVVGASGSLPDAADAGVSSPETPHGSRAILRSVGVNALSRMLAIPLSAVLGIIVTRLIIEQYGQASYAQYALLVGIGALLPFADLGIGAVIMNTIAATDDPRRDEHLRLVLVSAFRVLTCSAAVVVAAAAVLTATGAWPTILGAGLMHASGPTAAGLCLAVIGITLLVSVGQRIMAGLNRFYVVVILTGLQTPIVLATLLITDRLGVDIGGYVAVVSYLATFVTSAAVLAMANRQVRPVLLSALRDAAHVATVRGGQFLDTAWPMLIQMIALPIAMQTDRIVLSHVSTLDQLAEYSLASQMFTPMVGVIAVAGLALWPVFAKARAQGKPSDVSPQQMAMLFGAVALVLGLVLSLASGILSELATGGRIVLTVPLLVSFCALTLVQALKYPLGMYLTDAPGLRFQALMIVLMLPVNLGLSLVLARSLGAPGPVIGSVVGVLVFQVLANWFYVRRSQIRDLHATRRESRST